VTVISMGSAFHCHVMFSARKTNVFVTWDFKFSEQWMEYCHTIWHHVFC